MKVKSQITACLTLVLALTLVPLTSHARYLNPNTGRFQTMDTYEGNNSDPLSLHKYTYAHANPVNGIDPSGEFMNLIDLTGATALRKHVQTRAGLGQARAYQRGISIRDWNQAVASYQGSVSGSAVYKGAAITVAAIVAAGHFATLWNALDPVEEEYARARTILKQSVEEAAKEKGCGGRILYYYRDASRVAEAYSTRSLRASRSYPNFPEGAYASDIPPWDTTFTQTELAEGFFGQGQGWQNVMYFVAFCDDGTWNPLPKTLTPGIIHWHKFGKENTRVPISPICAGVNGMR